MNDPNTESIFRRMDDMMRQLDSFLLGPGLDDSRHDNGWQWPLFPRWPQPGRLPSAEPDEPSPQPPPPSSVLSPRDQLLKRPEFGRPQQPTEQQQQQQQLMPRRDVDLDATEDQQHQLPQPHHHHRHFMDPGRGLEDGGGGGWFSSSWGRFEESVRLPDGSMKRTVTTVGPDGRRSSATRLETPDGRVVDVEDGAHDVGGGGGGGWRPSLMEQPRHHRGRQDEAPHQWRSGASGEGGWGGWLRSWFK